MKDHLRFYSVYRIYIKLLQSPLLNALNNVSHTHTSGLKLTTSAGRRPADAQQHCNNSHCQITVCARRNIHYTATYTLKDSASQTVIKTFGND